MRSGAGNRRPRPQTSMVKQSSAFFLLYFIRPSLVGQLTVIGPCYTVGRYSDDALCLCSFDLCEDTGASAAFFPSGMSSP